MNSTIARRTNRGLALALLATTALSVGAFGLAAPAHAQQAASYDIPAGPLSTALNQFARQAQVELVYDAPLTNGASSPGLNGSYNTAEALSRLLAGTGVTYRQTGARVFTLERAPQAAQGGGEGSVTLGPVRVQGEGSGRGGGTVRQPADTRGTYTVPVTSSATGLDLAIKDTPQVVSVITRQRMDDQNLVQIADVMDQQPGITVERQGLPGAGHVLFRSRGFEVTNVMFDGVVTTGAATANFDLWGALDTAIYDRVEFVQGSTGLATGAGDPSGSVNFVRKRPTEETFAEFKAHYGTWDRWRLEGDYGGPLDAAGNIRTRFVVAHQQGESWQDRVDHHMTTLYGVAEADVTDNLLLTGGLLWTNIRVNKAVPFGMAQGGVYWEQWELGDTPFVVDMGRNFNPATNWSFTEIEMLNPFAKLEWRFADDWRLNANYMFTKIGHQRLYGGIGQGHYDVARDSAWYNYGHVDLTAQLHNLDLALTGKFHLLGREHDVMAGLSGYSGRAISPVFGTFGHGSAHGYIVKISEWSPDIPMPTDPTTLPDDMREVWPWNDTMRDVFAYQHFRERQYGGYAATRLRPLDAVSLILGARWNHWKRSGHTLSYDPESFEWWFMELFMGNTAAPLPPIDTVQNEWAIRISGKITPYAGIVVEPIQNITLYASYTGISKANISPWNSVWFRDPDGNPLPPITGNSIELGAKASLFDGRFNVQLTGYRMKQKNRPYSVNGPSWPNEIDWGTTGSHAPGKGQISDGIEFSAMGQIAPRVNISASYSYLRIRVQWRPEDEVRPGCGGANINQADYGERAFGCPAHTVKFFGTWQPLDALTVGGGFTWKSPTRAWGRGNLDRPEWAEVFAATTQGAVTVVDLMARYRITPQITLSANVQNLFDKKYMTANGMGGVENNGFYGAPRNVMVSVGFRY